MGHKAGDVLFGIIVLAMIFVATRSGSNTANVVHAFGGAFSNSIRAATGKGHG